MTTVNPTQPLHTLRQTARTCHELGVCLNPTRSCGAKCEQAMQRLAPGVIDGPYQRALSKAYRRTSLLAKAVYLVGAAVALGLLIAKLVALYGVTL